MKIQHFLSSLPLLCLCAAWAGAEETTMAATNDEAGHYSEQIIAFAPGEWAEWTTFPDREFKGDYWCAGDPSIIKDGDIYRMFFTSVIPERGGHCVIRQRISKDLIHWEYADTTGPGKGLMLDGSETTWDHAAETALIMKKGDEYWLYYGGYGPTGWQAPGNPGRIGLAISKDAIHFEKYTDQPIMTPTKGWYDENSMFSPSIVLKDGIYYMVYCGHAYNIPGRPPMACLLGATSKDGIHWEKREREVLVPVPEKMPWAKGAIAEAVVVEGPDKKYYLFFSGLNYDKPERYALGVAQGDTPFGPWIVNPDPIVAPSGKKGAFDEDRIIAPEVVIDGDTVRMWYHGFAHDNTISMGYAECKWPIRMK